MPVWRTVNTEEWQEMGYNRSFQGIAATYREAAKQSLSTERDSAYVLHANFLAFMEETLA